MKHLYEFCSNCGKLSGDIVASLCPNCFGAERSDYYKIREYLKYNPRSSAMEVALATNIPIEKITKYIKDQAFLLNK